MSRTIQRKSEHPYVKDRVEEDEGALEKRAAFVISTPEVSPGLTLYDHMMREYLV